MTRPDIVQFQPGTVGTDNDPEWPEVRYGGNPPRRKTDGGRVVLDWRAILAIPAGLLIVGLPLWLVYRFGYCAQWDDPCRDHGDILIWTVYAVLLTLIVLWLITWYGERQARVAASHNEARQLAVRPNRYGDAEPLALYEQPIGEAVQFFMARYLAATQLETAIAPHKRYSGVETLNEGAHTEIKTDLGPPQLAAPEAASGLVPPDTYLPWLLELHHAMIAGGTGTGKTTLARVVLGERLRMGYSGLVVDPKGKEWYGLPVVGGGRRFADILGTLDAVRAEMDRRFEAYGRGVRDFEPLVVLVDEVPDIMEACRDIRRRVVDGRWQLFVKQLGSLAREVQISVILLTQSPLVEDIGMNSAMRKNFTRVALGDEAPALINEERDVERRRTLREQLKGQAYPAALYRRGEVHLLDTSAIPTLAERPVRDVSGWEVPAPQPHLNGHAPDLATHAARVLNLANGDRTRAARALLARKGDQVRGGWQWEVKEIARALSMRDEDVSAIGRPK